MGALGNLLVAAALMLFAVSGLSFGFGAIFGLGRFGSDAEMISATVALLSVSLLLQSAGFYGIWRDSRTTFSALCFPFGIAISLTVLAISGLWHSLSMSWLFVAIGVLVILLGVLFVLQGLTYVALRKNSRDPKFSLVSGSLFIVGGLFLCSLYLQVVGDFLLAIPLAIGSLILVRMSWF